MASTTNSPRSFRRVAAISAAAGIAVMGSVAQQAHAAPVSQPKAPASHAVTAPRAQHAATPARAPQTGTHVWATTNVNVRSGAGLSHSRIGLLRTGHYTTQLEASQNGWTKVRYHGQVGYIYTQYLTHSGSTASSSESAGSYTPRHSAGSSSTSRSSERQSYTPRRSAESTYSSGSSSSSTTSGGGSCQASFYGSGSQTASGESFDSSAMTAASKTYAFGTKLKVTNQSNGKSVVVRINDRGPYVSGRCLDLSTGAFSQIASTDAGVATVTYQVVS